jgi:GTP-binding protein
MVLVCNKIDMMSKDDAKLALAVILRRHEFLKFIPQVMISGKEAINLPAMMNQLKNVYENRSRRITTSTLNDVLTKAWLTSPPHFPKNKICKRKYITQAESHPPVFMLSVNNKEYANFSFKRWVENALRKNFKLLGSPIKLVFSSKADNNPFVRVDNRR